VSIANDNFRVIANDDHGKPARCTYCTRGAKHVVVLPLTDRLDLEERIRAVDGEWIGLCAFCVLEMARALARAEGKL
jgi:hypothetical protein